MLFLAMTAGTLPIVGISDFLSNSVQVSQEESGRFISLGLFAGFIFAPFAGWIYDRVHQNSWYILLGSACNALCWSLMTQTESYPVMMILRGLEGISSAFIIGPLLALGSSAERKFNRRTGSVLGPMGMLLLVGVGVGLLLGGILSAKVGVRIPFYGAALLLGLVGALSLFIPSGKTQSSDATIRPHKAEKVLLPVRGKIGFVLAGPLLLLLMLAFADRFTAGFLMGAFLLHLKSGFLMDSGQAGSMLALVSFPMALGALPAVWLGRRLGMATVVGLGSVCFGILLPIATTFQSHWGLALVLLLCGISAALMYAPSLVLLGQLAPAGHGGLVLSLFYALGSLGYALGPVSSTMIISFLNTIASEVPILWPIDLTSITWTAIFFGLCELLPGLLLLIKRQAPTVILQSDGSDARPVQVERHNATIHKATG